MDMRASPEALDCPAIAARRTSDDLMKRSGDSGREVPEIQRQAKRTQKGLIGQYDLLPNRIDLINQIDGVEFEQAWPTRTTAWIFDGEQRTPVAYIGLEALVRNKEAAGRFKDRDDLKFLRPQFG